MGVTQAGSSEERKDRESEHDQQPAGESGGEKEEESGVGGVERGPGPPWFPFYLSLAFMATARYGSPKKEIHPPLH